MQNSLPHHGPDPFSQLADLAAAPSALMAPALLDLAALSAEWSRAAADTARPLLERAAAAERHRGALAAEDDVADDFAATRHAHRTDTPEPAGMARFDRLQALAVDEFAPPLDRWRAREGLAGYAAASRLLEDALRALAGAA